MGWERGEKMGLFGTKVVRWSEQRAKPAATRVPILQCSCLKPAQLFHACLLLIHKPGSKEEEKRGKHPTSLYP